MNTEHEDHINAYIGGDMSDAEILEFERGMETDPALAEEVRSAREAIQSARQWLESDPPGTQRLAALKIPEARAPARVISLFPALRRMSAAAAIFLCGILIGAWIPQNGSTTSPDEIANSEPSEKGEVTITATWESSFPAYALNITEPIAPSALTASKAEFRRSEGEDGEMIFENVTENSKWVIDSSFQMGSS